MRLVFLGTPEFAVPTLLALAASEHEISYVVTQPDRPKGRGYRVIAPPVKEAALQLGLPVLQPDKLAEIKAELVQAQPEAIVVVAFGQKIPGWLLELPRWGCINLHPSLLPKYRGAAPIQAALLNGDQVTGVTTMLMDEGWDTGDILLQEDVPILPGETAGELHDRLRELGARLVLQTLTALEKGDISPRPQDDALATYAPKLSKEAAQIDWSASAETIVNLVRANNPWPVAWTTVDGEVLKVWRAEQMGEDHAGTTAGTVIAVAADGIIVQTGSGQVKLRELQKSGGKRMDAASFVRGNPIQVGTILGSAALID
ncbi:MAG: methionyl-tRNA formyltransferase [Firmicutes bacterium]|nr:methionyl-tRNA formyltransferase [Bacillota bacterium]